MTAAARSARPRRVAVAPLALAWVLVPAAAAQFPMPGQVNLPWDDPALARVGPDPRVTALVADLSVPDFARREAASAALLDPAIPDEQVWIALTRPAAPLGPEARHRLIEVGRHRIENAPRGALGIQMAGRFGETDGVTVTGLIPNMPARKTLRPGDRIIELDGQPIRRSERLSEIVQARRPGDMLRAVVMRGERDAMGRVVGGPDGKPAERRLELTLEVGSRTDLERFGDRMMSSVADTEDRGLKVRELRARFAPVPVEVEPVQLPGERMDADSHPYVTELLHLLGTPGAALSPGQLAELGPRLSELRGMSRASGLTAWEREWYHEAAERYAALLERAASASVPESSP